MWDKAMKWNWFHSDRVDHELFRPRADSDWDFFPHGSRGRGYRVNTPQRSEIIRSIQRYGLRLHACLMAVFAIPFLIVVWVDSVRVQGTAGGSALAVVVLFVGWAAAFMYFYRRFLRRLASGLPLAEISLTSREEYGLYAAGIPRALPLLALATGPIGLAASIFGVWRAIESSDWSTVVILAAFTAFMGVFVWQYFQVWKNRPRG